MVAEVRRSPSAASLESDRSAKGKHRHSKRSTKVLKDWLTAHIAHPYPTEYEKEQLREATGMSVRQISHWFVNARRRQLASKAADPDSNDERFGASSAALPISIPPDDSATLWSDMSPLDRWRNSPPEEEPAQWDAITMSLSRGIASFSSEPNLHNLALPELSDQLDASVLTMSSSSASSAYSCSSCMSLPLLDSHSTFSRKRRRRRKTDNKRSFQASRKEDNRPFQCTFCTDRFRTRYDWTRHEGTLHLVLEKWTCQPLGTTYVDTNHAGLIRCSMCDEANPTDQHLQSHRSGECAGRPPNQRSFYRRDHLRQHLRAHHNIDDILPSMEQWKSKLSKLKSRCGFCGETFTVWSDRNDHIADHFRDGAEMKDWKGCRGLEPAVALLVQNAMPPYLIGTECKDFEPFSGSRAAGQNGFPTQFESLTAHLGDFVAQTQAKGIEITCDMLRTEARLFLYEDDDPLNQTPADNPTWMAMFTQGYGINCIPVEDPKQQNASADCKLTPAAMSSLPFTSGKMQHAAAFGSASVSMDLNSAVFDGHAGSNMTIPWSWQTPECLAEFGQMCEMQQLCGGIPDMLIDGSAPAQPVDPTPWTFEPFEFEQAAATIGDWMHVPLELDEQDIAH